MTPRMRGATVVVMADKWLTEPSPWAKQPKRKRRRKGNYSSSLSEKAERKRARRIKAGEDLDRRDRKQQHGVSVPTVSGGLPTLGRRR